VIQSWRCARYKRLLVDYAEEAVGGASKRRLEAHLQVCPACRSDLAALRTLPAQLRQCQVPDLGEEAWETQRRSIADAIRQAPQPRPRISWLPVVRWQPALTAFASLLLAIGIYRYSLHPRLIRSIEPVGASGDVLALDAYTFDHLIEVMGVLTPADDYLPHAAVDEETGDTPLSTLDDEELDGLADLVGVS